jgi:mannose-6-phosphate isomerase-like protein (cupin superfamily)
MIGIEGLLEKEFIGKEPRRESLLSCSGSERAAMIQLNGPMPERLYESGDVVYYVLGGDGVATIDGRRSPIKTNDFVSVPRGTAHTFERTGKRALVLLAVLSGEPCERAK